MFTRPGNGGEHIHSLERSSASPRSKSLEKSAKSTATSLLKSSAKGPCLQHKHDLNMHVYPYKFHQIINVIGKILHHHFMNDGRAMVS
jgi:hypothetical protein